MEPFGTLEYHNQRCPWWGDGTFARMRLRMPIGIKVGIDMGMDIGMDIGMDSIAY